MRSFLRRSALAATAAAAAEWRGTDYSETPGQSAFCSPSMDDAAAGGPHRVRVSIPRLVNLICLSLRSEGHTSSQDIRTIGDVVLYAELRDNNQGVMKILNGDLKRHPFQGEIIVEHETPVSAKLRGGKRIGMCVMSDAVNLALEKATANGVAVVGMSGYASSTGALGYWARKIASTGNVGIVMSTCPEMVAPHGSFEPVYGTNPIAIGFPSSPQPIVLDMATSAISWYAVVTAAALGHRLPADDLAYDRHGYLTGDPLAVLQKGALRPFDLSYKSSHLALCVELLAGALVGAAVEDKHAAKNWGSLVLVISPAALGIDPQELDERVHALRTRLKSAKPLEPGGEAVLPGQRGDAAEALALERGWVLMEERVVDALERAAEDRRVDG